MYSKVTIAVRKSFFLLFDVNDKKQICLIMQDINRKAKVCCFGTTLFYLFKALIIALLLQPTIAHLQV